MSRSIPIRASLVITAILLVAAPACGDGSTDARPTPSATATETAVATPISPPRIDATPLAEVTGLFSDPRPTRVDERRSLGPKPTTFTPWDGKSTMLYDTQAETETNLGPGTLGQFSPDGTKMVWIANPQPPFMGWRGLAARHPNRR